MPMLDIPSLDERPCNWHRWTKDEIGCGNYITPEKIAAAARLVRQGVTIERWRSMRRETPHYGGL